MRQLVNLGQVGKSDTALVGSKAAWLGELFTAEFDVPNAVVLTVDAYAQVIQSLRTRIDKRVTADAINDPAEIESLAGAVRGWIEAEPWPADLRTELANALSGMSSDGRPNSFAARTSLPSDELASAFGSGVQRAVLGLEDLETVERGAAKCWSALWTSRSMYYRHRKKIPQTAVSIAVLIQSMVPADSAGVVLTQNPLTADSRELQIDSIWGLGEPLAQARVKPDRFFYAKRSRSITGRQIEEKAVRLAVAADGTCEQQVVPAPDIEAPSLSDEQILRLASLAERIEEFFGEPQSIEWARVGEQFFVLQSLPAATGRN